MNSLHKNDILLLSFWISNNSHIVSVCIFYKTTPDRSYFSIITVTPILYCFKTLFVFQLSTTKEPKPTILVLALMIIKKVQSSVS